MKKLFSALVLGLGLLFLAPDIIWGQSPVPVPNWTTGINNYPKQLFSLSAIKNHNYVVTTSSWVRDSCQRISFLDDSGNILWEKNLNQPGNGFGSYNSIDMNGRDNFIVMFSDTIMVLDYSGNIVEKKVLTGNGGWGGDVFKSEDNYFFTKSYFPDNSIICVYDNDLSPVRTFSVESQVQKVVASGNYIYTSHSVDGGGVTTNSSSDLNKYDIQGNLVWSKHFPDQIRSRICVSNDGNYIYFSGSKCCSQKPGLKWEVTKLDANGNILWIKDWLGDYQPGTAWLSMWMYEIMQSPTGGCIVIGSSTKLGQDTLSPNFNENFVEPVAISVDASGEIQWKLRIAPPNVGGEFELMTWNYQNYLMIAGSCSSNSQLWKFNVAGVTPVEREEKSVPNSFSLSQNYPNPFNPSTTIEFSITKPGFVSLKVYDLLGREVATLVNEDLPTGSYKSTLDAQKLGLASGVYIYSLKAQDFSCSKKMILAK